MDVLGRELTPTETRILALYSEVKGLLEQDDLAPGVRANLKATLAHLWQVVNYLDLEFEQLYETYGI
jgi:hypothetical protein